MDRRQFIMGSAAACFLGACAGYRVPGSPDASPVSGDIWFLDVGYGDAIVLKRGDSAAMIDGGYPVMTERILKFLGRHGIARLTSCVVTHMHPDHVGGVYGVLASGFPVDTVYGINHPDDPDVPVGFRNIITRTDIRYRILRRNDTFALTTGFPAHVFHPDALVPDMNDSSLVIKTGGPGNGTLFCADIGPGPQQDLADTFGSDLASRVIKMPHHGGQLSAAFLDAVDPECAIISVGVNPYGPPSSETLEMIRKRNIRLFRTDISGTIHIHG